ncbi:protein DMR6-LIKE OXYGENASE 1 [Brachypodium distachyon]|uniref:Fe2OG dioxygenase domain-containing protein n=1 Tax=Brachypodium distachyon TaxID=15368 RepID=I1I9I6_BRADI|nr:protein DMR6-LIKE OXYGENASE 1 [Brachypodium distachyon]KQJ99390.1 hypothetical protein BRADI_3g42990v3 [Brachypodium distachyon]|eukprot:XP_003572506.3 protein DMR6-LIKE OXYGENASE 1 [Brachypodium distachyon]
MMAIVGVLSAGDHGAKVTRAFAVVVEEEEDYCLKGVRHLSDAGITKLPAPYVLPPSDRPSSSSSAAILPSSGAANNNILKLPVVDLAHLRGAGGPWARAAALKTLDAACREHGFFHVTNHGVSVEDMLDVSRRFFFDLPFSERSKLMSADVRAPVRYGTSFNQARDAVLCWRDFLKLDCRPSSSSSWPAAPADLRAVAGAYAAECRRVAAELVAAAMEALGIAGSELLTEKEEGSQMLTVNCYPECPEPEKTLGMPPHSDYGLLTLVLQDDVAGLQVMRRGGEWLTVDPLPGSFVVNVGDHFEIYSNGRYKSVLHRVRVNSARPRISVASFHSVAADRAVGPAPELLAVGEPPRYMDTDFATFLAYIASAEGKHKTFLESRRLDV